MKIEYAKVSALGDREENQDRAAVVVAEDPNGFFWELLWLVLSQLL